MLTSLTSLRPLMKSSTPIWGQDRHAVPWQGPTTRPAGVQQAGVKNPGVQVPVLPKLLREMGWVSVARGLPLSGSTWRGRWPPSAPATGSPLSLPGP